VGRDRGGRAPAPGCRVASGREDGVPPRPP
jgi:hypothetical protein